MFFLKFSLLLILVLSSILSYSSDSEENPRKNLTRVTLESLSVPESSSQKKLNKLASEGVRKRKPSENSTASTTEADGLDDIDDSDVSIESDKHKKIKTCINYLRNSLSDIQGSEKKDNFEFNELEYTYPYLWNQTRNIASLYKDKTRQIDTDITLVKKVLNLDTIGWKVDVAAYNAAFNKSRKAHWVQGSVGGILLASTIFGLAQYLFPNNPILCSLPTPNNPAL